MPRSYLRPALSGTNGHHRVTNIELFFDLVFVFAVTQLSHLLIANFTLVGGAQALLLMLAVWWVWIFTSWVTNWLDPEKLAIRLLLLVLMTAGLLLSASLPQAFGSRGLAFALAYVFMQFGRTLFFLWAVRGESRVMRRNFQRIAAWLGASALPWLAGGLADGSTRWVCWMLALGIEWIGPTVGFYTPGLGRSTVGDWNVEGGHMAERCSLFIIIALGESVLVTGSTFAGLDWDAANIAAMAVSFIGSLAMWWLYFDTIAERGAQTISHATDPGRLALARAQQRLDHRWVARGADTGRRRAGRWPCGGQTRTKSTLAPSETPRSLNGCFERGRGCMISPTSRAALHCNRV
ncbi:low temperature requirement protein A [Nannocystis sp. ILAH1]|nr:low temperature requirement protein A [Nannocystis sp. ILAH1]MCY0994854.1 low temperature requirement protein A [Nannocystis sp. ILAH1]